MSLKSRLLVLSVLVFSATGWAQQHPIIGTWKTNPAKSTIHLGPPTTSNITTIEASGPNGIKYTSERTNARGETARLEYTANFDGKTYPYTAGGPSRDGVAIKQVNPRTYQLSYKLNGETVQINYWIVAPDGQTMTTISTGLTGDGEVYSRAIVQDRQ